MLTHLMKHYQDELTGDKRTKGREKAITFRMKTTLYRMTTLIPQKDTVCFLQPT